MTQEIWETLTDDQKQAAINEAMETQPETPDFPDLAWETVSKIFGWE